MFRLLTVVLVLSTLQFPIFAALNCISCASRSLRSQWQVFRIFLVDFLFKSFYSFRWFSEIPFRFVPQIPPSFFILIFFFVKKSYPRRLPLCPSSLHRTISILMKYAMTSRRTPSKGRATRFALKCCSWPVWKKENKIAIFYFSFCSRREILSGARLSKRFLSSEQYAKFDTKVSSANEKPEIGDQKLVPLANPIAVDLPREIRY